MLSRRSLLNLLALTPLARLLPTPLPRELPPAAVPTGSQAVTICGVGDTLYLEDRHYDHVVVGDCGTVIAGRGTTIGTLTFGKRGSFDFASGPSGAATCRALRVPLL